MSSINKNITIQPIEKAQTIEMVYKALLKRPLAISEMNEFYKDTDDARGQKVRHRVARRLNDSPDINNQFLFVGYRGCGKSTELNHLELDIQDNFLVINFSIFEELDASNINYIEIFIVTMERLFANVIDKKLKISDEFLQSITDFIKTKEITEVHEKYFADEGSAGADAKFNLLGVLNFFANFKTSLKLTRSLKTDLKEKVEPHFPKLIENCNFLINEIRLQLPKLGKKDIVIIIEDLDKINIDVARDLFFIHAIQITLLRANVIYTFPISLYHDTQFTAVKNSFSQVYELPMIKVAEKNGERDEKGFKALRNIVFGRLNKDLFDAPQILDDMINYCGGCLRDLFEMINDAVDNARDDDRKTISENDAKLAYYKLKNEYDNTIADYVENGKVVYKASDFYKLLTDLALNPIKKLENSQAAMILRQNLTILGYNGDYWCDVHPIVKGILVERGYLEKGDNSYVRGKVN